MSLVLELDTQTEVHAYASNGKPRPDYHEQFAAIYDALYRDRDVAGEVRLAAEALGLGSTKQFDQRLFDFGCGTGSHVIAFAERGIAATGFDISTAMIAQARLKRPRSGAAAWRFFDGEFRDFCAQRSDERYHAATSFFNVLNCMRSPALMLENLRLIEGCLAPGAMLLADVWNGAAVFVDEPRPDVRHYAVPSCPTREIVRITNPRLDRIHQTCRLQYRVLTLDRGDGSFTEFDSIHELHFLTPVQYRHLFELAGFQIVAEFPKGKPADTIDSRTWYISYLVKKPK
jgi:SAM-dependent methyltransferase